MQIEKELNYKLFQIKKQGWINCTINGYNKFGIKLENMLGIESNSNPGPDYKGIEIKTKNYYGQKYISLFSLKPCNSTKEIYSLCDKYGYPSKSNNKINVFNVSVNGKNFIGLGNYLLKLQIDKRNNFFKLLILTADLKFVDNSIAWHFNDVKNKLLLKTKNLCIILHENTKRNGEYFSKIKNYNFYKFKNFDDFIYAVEKGHINISFKLGIYLNGDNINKLHNHGISFDINRFYIQEVFKKTGN